MTLKSLLTAATLLAATALAKNVAHANSDYRVDRFTSNLAWNANSWILESDTGLVLIDAQMLKGDVRHLAAMLKAYDKPLAGVIITHPHPDHFLGLAELRRRLGSFPIIGGKDTDEHMEAARDQFLAWARDVYGDDVEDQVVHLTRIVEKDMTLTLAGIPLVLDRFGAGEAADHLLVYQPDRKLLFTGDVTMSGSHLYVGEGRSAEVVNQLQRLKTEYADAQRIFSGHGDPTRIHFLDDLLAYVEKSRDVFNKLANSETNRHETEPRLTDSARSSFVDQMERAYPTLGDFGLTARQVLTMNLAGLEREILGTASGDESAP